MCHLHEYRRDDFLAHHYRRSNAEGVFSVVEAKFGESLLAKTEQGQATSRRQKRHEIAHRWRHAANFRLHRDVWEEEPLEIPAALWLNGTVSALKAPALAALLVLLHHESEPGAPVRIDKSRFARHGVQHHTWWRGLVELEDYGCVKRIHDKNERVFAATGTARVPTDRYRTSWSLQHRRLYGMDREQLPQ